MLLHHYLKQFTISCATPPLSWTIHNYLCYSTTILNNSQLLVLLHHYLEQFTITCATPPLSWTIHNYLCYSTTCLRQFTSGAYHKICALFGVYLRGAAVEGELVGATVEHVFVGEWQLGHGVAVEGPRLTTLKQVTSPTLIKLDTYVVFMPHCVWFPRI